jgi:hypothetical protein
MLDWSSGTYAFATHAKGWRPRYAGRYCESLLEFQRIRIRTLLGNKLLLRAGVVVQVIIPSTTSILAHETDVLPRCVRRTIEDLSSCRGRTIGNRVRRVPLNEQEII